MNLELARMAFPDLTVAQLRRRGIVDEAEFRKAADGDGDEGGAPGDGEMDDDDDMEKAANVAGLRDWIGRVGFDEGVKHIATKKDKRGQVFGEERAKKIAGKLKGMANHAGTLAPAHSYDPKVRAEFAKAVVTGKPIGTTHDGKAIYDEYDNPAHRDFTASDHYDAENLHRMLAQPYQREIDKLRDSALASLKKRHPDSEPYDFTGPMIRDEIERLGDNETFLRNTAGLQHHMRQARNHELSASFRRGENVVDRKGDNAMACGPSEYKPGIEAPILKAHVIGAIADCPRCAAAMKGSSNA